MKICVTGSSGFIGKSLVNALLTENHQVLGIDEIPSKEVHPNFRNIQCDILDLDKLEDVLVEFQPQIIFHLAARTDLNEKKTIEGYATNTDGVRNLVQVVCKLQSVSRVIYTSSQLVCEVGYIPTNPEDYKPSTLYGQSKVITEQIVREADGGDTEWCIVRPTTVWGPGMSPHYQRFFQFIISGKYFHVGNKELFKSYSYIGNIVFQYMQLMTADVSKINQKTFYLADYTPISLKRWANLFSEALGAKPIPTYPFILVRVTAYLGDLINFIGFKDFPFNSFRLKNILTEYIFDLSQTKDVCGTLPYSTEEGVKATVKWLQEN